MRDFENIRNVADLAPDYMGFIFYPGSKRFAGRMSPDAIAGLPSQIVKTGVFVNAGYDEIEQYRLKYNFTAVQLHGNESPDFCLQLKNEGLLVIKAFGIGADFDFDETSLYMDAVHYFLFDTLTVQHGGSGTKFDWSALERYPHHVPYFLSGGIGPGDIESIKQLTDSRLYAIDINSRVETAPGMKDIDKIKRVFKQLKRIDQ